LTPRLWRDRPARPTSAPPSTSWPTRHPRSSARRAVLRVSLGSGWPPALMVGGQGLDGIISKAPPSRRRAPHTAAVLAVWRDRGRYLDALPDEASAVSHPPGYIRDAQSLQPGRFEQSFDPFDHLLAKFLGLGRALCKNRNRLPHVIRRT
jgi:hypothetical protein